MSMRQSLAVALVAGTALGAGYFTFGLNAGAAGGVSPHLGSHHPPHISLSTPTTP